MDHDGVLALAIGVVQQAVDDATHRKPSDPFQQVDWQRTRADAREFLMQRLWDPDNIWGAILSHYGMGAHWKDGLRKTLRIRGAGLTRHTTRDG